MKKGAAVALLSCLVLLPFLLLGFGLLGEASPLAWAGLSVLALLAGLGLATALTLALRLQRQTADLAHRQEALTRAHTLLEEQKQELHLYAGAAQSAKMGYFAWDLVEDRCIRCSEEYAALHGVTLKQYFEGDVDLQSDADFVHPDDRADYLSICAETLRKQQPLDIQYRIVTKQGHVRHVRELEHSFITRNGVPVRSEGMIQDITDLRRSETLLLAAMNAGAAVFAIFDPDDRLILANPAYILLFGEKSVEIKTGTHYETIVRGTAAAGSIQGSKEEIETWVQTRLARREHPAKGLKFQSEEGRWFEVDDVVLDDGHVFTMGADITERIAMESRLQSAQRMEAVGQLAAGMAHDFNNLLEIIHGNAELLSDRADEEAKMLEAIQSAALRAGELTQNLLTFSSRQQLRPQTLALDPLVRDLVRQFRRRLDKKIEIKTEVEANLPPITADPGQLENALTNLMSNAVQAMSDGGALTISCRHFEQDTAKIANLTKGKQYLSVAVSDSGTGMEPEILAQAFDPFFTTDPDSKRSGLGLSMVYGFAQQSGGQIELVSHPGIGTEARLILPVAERLEKQSAALRQPSDTGPSDAAPSPGVGERILLLDDDDAVRAVLKAHLKRLGYRIAEASTPERALTIMAQEEIDLALVDIMLSDDYSGPQFVDQARQSQPGLPVIYISGYSADRAALDPRTPLLTKPFTRHVLAHALTSVLKREPEREPATN